MINNIKELYKYFEEHDYPRYERDHYDKFIKDTNFEVREKCIHITGTNGKGSTAFMLAGILIESGYKVGIFTSPFFYKVNEMIRINSVLISDAELLSIFNMYQEKFEQYDLSSFEMQTIIAFEHFHLQAVDAIVVEAGMGGYIDATNIIEPILSIITSVSMEHTAFLGRSVSEIAANKAGIIKPEVPVLIAKLDEESEFAIRERAKELKAPLYVVGDYHHDIYHQNYTEFDYLPHHGLTLFGNAKYQLKNASLAIEASHLIRSHFKTDDICVFKGLKFGSCITNFSCRFQMTDDNVLIDGAHNPEAVECLVESLRNLNTIDSRPIHVIFAAFKDKNIDPMLISLEREVSSITLTTFEHKRARKEEDYFLYLGDYQFVDGWKTLIESKKKEFPNDIILVTGSLAFAALAKKYLLGSDEEDD